MALWDSLLSEHDKKVDSFRKFRQQTGFGERPALIVIDMNVGAVGEDRPIFEQLDKYPGACGPFAWAALKHMQKLIPAARNAGVPVIYSKHIFKAIHGLPKHDDPSFPYSELSPLSEIQPEVAMEPGDLLIEKQKASVFFHTPLLYVLMAQKVDSLILIGNSTSGCVRATAVDGSYYPAFKISVVEECVFDRIELSHKAALFDMQFKYCDVVGVDKTMKFLEQLAEIKAERAAAN